MDQEKKCHRCGRCCQYMKDGKLIRCKYLIGKIGGITSCRIYRQRLGTIVDDGIGCFEVSPYNWKDCEYNDEGKPWIENAIVAVKKHGIN